MKKLVIATRNKKKKKELQNLLKGLHVRLLSSSDFKDIPSIRENGKTFSQNAIKKAIIISRFTKVLTIADDSGLEVGVLRGKPGVRSSRFSGKGATDQKNIKKLLHLMEGIPTSKRKARFSCSIAIAKKGVLLKVMEGRCRGSIGFKENGKFGFGYDPVFIVPRYGKTFAQLGPKIKNKISHRAKALKKARIFIEKYLEKYP